MTWKKFEDERPEDGKRILCIWENGTVLICERTYNFYKTQPTHWCYITTPGEDPRIQTPPDIYKGLFDGILRPVMEYHHSGGKDLAVIEPADHEKGEMVGRITEFLEKHLREQEG